MCKYIKLHIKTILFNIKVYLQIKVNNIRVNINYKTQHIFKFANKFYFIIQLIISASRT